jgi:diguanylate cyclase (GGDEF)-like protein
MLWGLIGLCGVVEALTLVWLLASLRRRQAAVEARLAQHLADPIEARLRRLESLSYLDPLTALRSGLVFRLELGELSRSCRSLGLLYIDLDDFRRFNESGHRLSGDTALTLAAEALRRALRRQSDRLYRLHGDEFAALLPGADAALLEYTAQLMLAQLTALRIGGRSLSATIGGALGDGRAAGTELERAADRACQAQKKRAKGCYVLASASDGPGPQTPGPQVGAVPVPTEEEVTFRRTAPPVLSLVARR